jgi:acyl-CoA thioester hydrolase
VLDAHSHPRGDVERGAGLREHSCTLTVRSYECDSYGHVNNAVYLNYLEYARHEYLKDINLPLGDLRAAGYAMWVVEVTIRFKRPALIDDGLRILTKPLKRSRVTGVLGQRILRGGEELAEAEVRWVCVDGQGRPAPLPQSFEREGLAP